MAQYLPLPDGTSLKLREGESPDAGWERAQKMYPDAFGGRKEEGVKRDTSGFKAAASAGLSRLQGEAALTAGKLGILDPERATQIYKSKEEEAAARFTPTEAGWTESPFLKFKETLGGSLPYMAAPAAAGIAALAAPVSAPVAAGLGLVGAGAVSTGQFTGSNIARQMGTGKTLEETSGAAAFGAAVPQALLDTAAMALLPGVGKLFSSVGSKLTTEQAKAIASQTLGRTVADYAAKTGAAMTREGLTEATQQVLERVQAGLNISDPEARKEYIDSFIGGAVLGGTLAPVGRAFERGAAKSQAAQADKEAKDKARQAQLLQQEQTRAAEQQRLADEAAAAEAERNSPEYALRIAQEYSGLEQKVKDLQSQLRKGTKDKPLTAEDRAFNAEITAQLKETGAALKESAVEKNRVTKSGLLEQAQEAQRREQLSPMEYMLEQTPEVTESKFTPVEPDMAGFEMPEPVVPEKPLSPVEMAKKYATESIALANDMRMADEKDFDSARPDYIEFLMRDPQMAAEMVKTRTKMPNLTAEQSNDLLDALKLQLNAIQETQAEEKAVRQEEVLAGMTGKDRSQEMLGAMREQPGVQAAQEERVVEDRRMGKVLPEVEALRRIAEKPTAPVRDEDQLVLQVDALVDELLKGGPAPAGRVVSGVPVETASKADTLRAQLAYANATDNRERGNELKKQLADLNEPDTEKAAGDLEFGQAAKEAGIEGRLSVDAMRANRITRLSSSQMQAYDRLADFVQRVRDGNQDVSDTRKQTLTNAAERMKETVVGLALNEIDARRAQAGLPELPVADKAKAVGQLNTTLDELIERGAGLFQKPVERPAQVRGTKTVVGALEPVRQPVGRRVFNNYDAAAKVLRGQMRDVVDRIGGFEQKESKLRPAPKVQRAQPTLRTQFQSTQERSVPQQFLAAYERVKSDEDRQTLETIERQFKNLSETAQEEALVQVRRVETGQPLEVRGQLKDELADLKAAGVSDTGQAELFPGESEKGVTRTTPARFMALLNSRKIAELKAKLAEENRVMEFQAKRAATLEAKAKQAAEEAEAFQQKLLASKAKSPVQQAKEALTRLVGPEGKAAQAVELADEIVTQRNAVRTRLRSMISQIEDAERKALKQFTDVQTLFDFTNKQLTDIQAEAVKAETPPRMADLALWTEARNNQEPELKKAQKTLDTVRKSLEAARATLARVTEDHASNVLDNSIIREGEKAQRKIDKAKAALEQAMADERAAARVVAADKQKRPEKQPSDKERLEEFARAAKADVIRVYRDTSDPSVQARVADERKNIAAAEEAHDKAQAAGDKLGMENALRRIEAAYNKTYSILNNAPVRRDTETMASHVEVYARAQAKALEATARLFEEQAGIKPLKMAERRTVATVKNVKTGRLETQYKQESVAAQEARVKKEAETGAYPARALEELAKARAERAEVQAQIDYIDANPAAPRSEGKARQVVARKKAVEKRKALDAKIKTLTAAQKEVVAEARIEKKAEKQLRQEGKRMARSAGYLQEAVGEGETYEITGPGAFFAESPSLLYKGRSVEQLSGGEKTLLIRVNGAYGRGFGEFAQRLSEAVASAKAKLQSVVENSSGDPRFQSAVRLSKEALEVLKDARVSDFSLDEERAPNTAPRAVKAERAKLAPVPKTPENVNRRDIEQKAEAKYDDSYALHGLTYKDAAQRMADESTNDKDRAFFERLVEVFEVLPEDPVFGRVYGSSIDMSNTGSARGVFVAIKKGDAVFVKTGLSAEQNRHVVMHELAHAASVYAIKANPELDEQITKLREKVEAWVYSDAGDKFMYENFTPRKIEGFDDFQELYGLRNNKEFIAEAFSSEGFQKILAEIPSDKPKLSIFSRLVNYLAKALGLSDKAMQSSLAEALALTEKLFNRTRNELYASSDFVKKNETSTYEYNALSDLADKIVAQPKTFGEKVKDVKALELEMTGVDMRAGLQAALKRGAEAMGDDRLYQQAMYSVRKADQKMPLTYAAMSNGPLELYKDEKGFYGVRSSGKDSAVSVFEAVGQVPGGSSQEKFALASAYLIAQRAANKGLSKLDTGSLGVDDADLDAAMAAAKADPALGKALEEVRRRYNAYNKGMIEFLADTGAISKKLADELLSSGDYVPFYRVDDSGMAELVFSEKMVVSIGDIRSQPYLAELKGGEQKILPLSESLPRNTLLLVDKGLTNLAQRNVAYGLQAIGKGQGPVDAKTGKPRDLMAIHKGDGPADPRVIRFNQEPDPTDSKDDGKRWVKVESNGTAIEGIPAELVVKSLEGAHLPLPGFLKLGGAAADLLRAGVTRTPLYIARQLYREPMAAAFTGGLNYTPFRAVLEAGKEYVRSMRGTSETQAKLIEKGLIQSNVFSGDVDDVRKIAMQLAAGNDQSTIDKVFNALDRAAINADAATRALVYDNARKNGLSEVEADMMTMESMNFYKRGLSPTVQYANRLIPFLNAQIQGLNVLYKAATGKMPFEEQLKIKRKFYNNAMLLFATGIVYAMAMEDDEYFKNARPRDKYTNFFLHLPGVEEPIKIATPFEAGYFFSLAVAAVDGMKKETNNAEQFAALRDMFLNSIPGYSSMGVPQIVKPVFEVWTNKNFFSGAPIESLRLRNMDITERYNESTTELAKAMSKAVPILSPIQIEHIVRGYLGIAPLAAAAMINGAVPTPERGERPTARASDLPFLGSAFQRKMGGAQADEVYDLAEAAFQSRATFNNMLKEGRREEALAYRQENRVELASAIDAGQYRQLVGRLNADIRRTQNRTDLTGDEKRARIDRLEDAKLKAAKDFLTRYKAREDRLGD